MKKSIKILILEDDEKDVKSIIKVLEDDGFDVLIETCGDSECFTQKIDEFIPDVIVAEHTISGYDSFMALNDARTKLPNVIFILITRTMPEEFAIELLKEGMDDYVLKDHILHLPHTIKKSYEDRMHFERAIELEKKNNELKSAYSQIEAKNQYLTQSIIFAERIQNLVLPNFNKILEDFKEAFIIFRPKDIVSGDFYWYKKRDDKYMISVADCTGHGVPGALLSLIGINFLNEIGETNYDHPTDVLSVLDENITSILKQNENSGYQDGIDIAFITIDKKHKRLYFSGCKRPLLIYRRRDKKMEEHVGNQYYIGGVDSRIKKLFTSQEIPYQTGDVIYLFSDGAVDQFGGPKNKKLMKRNFIDMLMSFQHLSLTYQGQLLDQKLKKWQGSEDQIDDIIILGLKL